MNIIEFKKQFPAYKVVKTDSVSIGNPFSQCSPIIGIYNLTDTGHLEMTWKDPFDEKRFCLITTGVYDIFLNS